MTTPGYITRPPKVRSLSPQVVGWLWMNQRAGGRRLCTAEGARTRWPYLRCLSDSDLEVSHWLRSWVYLAAAASR